MEKEASVDSWPFAERHEEKGFLEILLSPGRKPPVHSVMFHPLPARPMEDVYLDGVTPDALEPYLRTMVARLNLNAIVRLRSRTGLTDPVRGILTRSFLDRVFPASMNVQLSSELFRPGG